MTAHPARRLRTLVATAALLTLTLLQGCSIYKLAGDQVIAFSKQEMVPYLLTYDDTQMSCSAGEALTPLLMTFEAVGSDPNQLAVMVFTASGLCAESQALDQELRYLRAIKLQQPSEAQDARTAQKRWHELAARRQYVAHQRFLRYYGDMQNGRCSDKLEGEFDQLMYLVGLVSGLQSILNDTQSGQAVGVPRDIAAKVERMAGCIDNNRWWGLPEGVRAALWDLLPTLAPEGAKPMDVLARIARRGEYRAQGVRIGHAIWALAAWGHGDKEMTKTIIRDYAATERATQVDPRFRMVDAMANQMILAISDRLWTEATGARTPMGSLGKFWDDPPRSAGNIDDLL